MNKNYFLASLFIIFFSFLAHSQIISEDGQHTLKFKLARKNSKFEFSMSNYTISPGKESKKVQVRFKIRSVSNKRVHFNPNYFYLISEKHKARFRPVDAKHSMFMGSYQGFGYIHKEFEGINYKEEHVKDHFPEYKKEGYVDVESCINYGTKRKPKQKCYRFNHYKIRNNIVDVYFIVPMDFYEGQVYHGDQLVAEIEVK